jgi:hypothetical protein
MGRRFIPEIHHRWRCSPRRWFLSSCAQLRQGCHIQGHRFISRQLPSQQRPKLQLHSPKRRNSWRSHLCLVVVQQDRQPRNLHELCHCHHWGGIKATSGGRFSQRTSDCFLLSSESVCRQPRWVLYGRGRQGSHLPRPWPRAYQQADSRQLRFS